MADTTTAALTTVDLGVVPSLPRLYAAALGNAARRRTSGYVVQLKVPPARHCVRGAQVDVEHLTAFQRLVHAPVGDTLPSGFVHAFAFPVAMSIMARPDFPLPLLGLVHLRNSAAHARPINFRETLDVCAWAENLRAHRSGLQVDLVARVSAGGETVWQGRSTYLAKGMVAAPGMDTTPGMDTAPGTDPGSRMQPEGAARQEFHPPRPTARWRLGADAGRNYAAVSGDYNPIHLSAVSARMLGMKRQLAHGMYLASRVLEEAQPPGAEPFSWNIEFESPVFLPARVDVSIRQQAGNSGIPPGEPLNPPGEALNTEFVGWNQETQRRHFHGSISHGAGINSA